MLTHPTSDRLEALGFTGMAKALDEQRRTGATFENLSFEGDGRHARVLKSIERTELLILDDWGLTASTLRQKRVAAFLQWNECADDLSR